MTVPQRTYTDTSLQYMQFLQGLGGTERTTTGDPGAMDALARILQTQMGQLTPEGIAGLIREIFEQGGKAVPQIATQFGQSAGARTSSNSGINIANANLQKELASKSMSAIMQAQQAAANTAAVLGGLNKTESTGSTASWAQLLPFAPAAMKTLGINKLFDPKDSAANASFDTGANTLNGMSGSTFNYDSGASYGFDVGGGFGGSGFDAVDFGGSSVDLSGGGFDGFDAVDLGGGSADFDFSGFDLGFKDGGRVDRETIAKKLAAQKGKKPKGYAEGGQVTRSVNSGPQFGLTGPGGAPIRGITYNGLGNGGSIIPELSAITGVGGTEAGRSFEAPKEPSNLGYDTNGSGAGISVPSVVGTPSENAAAIAGMVSMAVATALGIPAAVPAMAMTAMGIPNSSMSPVGKSISAIMSMLSQAVSGISNDDSVAPPTEGGMSTVGPTGAGMSTTAAASQGLTISLDSIADAVDDGMTAVDGMDAGTSGDSGDSVGDAAAAGVGGGGFKAGGKIKGKGTETSDSINIDVSDGEYILNAEATEMFLPLVEMMNALGLQQRGGK